MTSPTFTVPVADLDWGQKDVDLPIGIDWLRHALKDSEARPGSEPGRLELTLSKNGREVMVRGRVTATLEMDDARTLDPAPVEIDSEVFLLLSPAEDPVVAEIDKRRQQREKRGRSGAKKDRKRTKQEQEEEESLSLEDASRDVFSGDKIVLDPFLREFILLDLPLFPLRSEDSAAIAPPPSEAAQARVDPRLAPLAAIAEQLKSAPKDGQD